jgi:hypothetical protein
MLVRIICWIFGHDPGPLPVLDPPVPAYVDVKGYMCRRCKYCSATFSFTTTDRSAALRAAHFGEWLEAEHPGMKCRLLIYYGPGGCR